MQERILLSYREQKYAVTNHVVAEFHFVLQEETDPGALEKAVHQALALHPQFRMKIMRGEDGLFYFEANEELPVIAEFFADKKIYYGTEEYHFYPWQIFRSGRNIRITGSHAVADGTGYMHFMRAVLHIYFALRGHVFSPAATERDLAAAEDPAFSPFSAVAVKDCNAPGVPVFQESARIPEELFETDPDRWQLRRIVLRRQDITERARLWETSTSPVISYYIARAMQEMLRLRKGSVCVRVPINLRSIFPYDTDRTFSIGIPLSYDISRMCGKPSGFVTTAFRSRLDLMTDRDNLILKIRQEQRRMEQLRQCPETLDTLPDAFRALRRKAAAEITYTHITRTGFSTELEELIDMFEMDQQPMPDKTLVVHATTLKSEILLNVYEPLKANALSRMMEEVIREDGVFVRTGMVPRHARAEHITDQF